MYVRFGGMRSTKTWSKSIQDRPYSLNFVIIIFIYNLSLTLKLEVVTLIFEILPVLCATSAVFWFRIQNYVFSLNNMHDGTFIYFYFCHKKQSLCNFRPSCWCVIVPLFFKNDFIVSFQSVLNFIVYNSV